MPNLTFNYIVSASQPAQFHIAHKLLGGDDALALPEGFGRGSHHMLPLDASGRINTRPGPSHRSLYFGRDGAATTYSATDIAAAEGLSADQITGDWIKNQTSVSIAPYRWGEHPDYALADNLVYLVTQAYLRSGPSVPVSLWIHFERGGSFRSIGYTDAGRDGYLRHPIVFKSFGSGPLPVMEIGFGGISAPEDNFVLEELDYGKITDPALPASRIKAAANLNQPSKNWLINLCDLSGKDHNFLSVQRFTLRRNRINDSVYNRPADGSFWSSGGLGDRIQGAFVNNAISFCFLENIFVQSGWKDGYDAVNDPATGPNQPPSQYSHGLYVQNEGTDMTYRGNVATYVSSQAAKFQYGAHVTENFFFENPHAFYVWGSPEYQPSPNYSTVWGNVVVGSRWDDEEGNKMNDRIAYLRGMAHYDKANYAFHWNNAVLHSDNPNDPAEAIAKPQSGYVQGYAEDLGDQAPWGKGLFYTYNWQDVPSENIALADAEMDDLTFHYWLDDHLSQPRGTATTLECVDWFRTATFDYIGHIVGNFLTTLGGPWNASVAPATISFTPDPKGEGWRWDGRYNWDLTRRPVTGDIVRLDGADPVVSWENMAPSTLDLGAGAALYIDGGLINVGTLTGSGIITIIEAGELAVASTSGADVAINLNDGGLTIKGSVTGLSVIVNGNAECVVAGGQSLTFGAGRTFRIEGDSAKAGYDGAAGLATITMETGSTLEFVAGSLGFSVLHKTYTGLAGLDAYNRPNPVGVTSAFAIASGTTLNVDVTGLAPGTTYDLILADSVTGAFDAVNVTGGSATPVYTATKVSISVA